MPKVADLMTVHADRVPLRATLGDAAALMVEARISSVIVVDGGKAVGIVTERDVLSAMRQHNNTHRPVADVMTSPVHTVLAETDFRDAYRDATRLGIRHLVVVDTQQRPVGVVAESDFRRHMGMDFFSHMNDVSALMEQDFPVLPPVAKLEQALALMEQRRASCVLVVESGLPVGIVTERDVVRLFLDEQGAVALSQVMTSPVRTISSATSLNHAAALMQEQGFRHLAVVDQQGKLVGLLSEHSLMRLLELDFVDDVVAERLEQAAANEARLQIELDLARALAEGKGRQSILEIIVDVALRFPEFDAGAMYTLQESGAYRLAVHRGLSESFAENVRDLANDEAASQLLRQGELICSCLDSSIHCSDTQLIQHAVLRAEGMTCVMFLPIKVNGQSIACLMLGGHRVPEISHETNFTLQSLSIEFALTLGRLATEEGLQLAASVFEHAHDGIMITDTRGRILDVNNTFTKLTGFSRTEAVGKNADLLKSGHHEQSFYDQMWRKIADEGYWRGEIWNRKKSGELMVEMLTISAVRSRAGDITHYLGIFADITELKQQQARLEQLAHFDPLTQLPNRMLLHDRLQHAMAQANRSDKLLAVCYLDLDGFKPVNDTLGHETGDLLLIEVAQRLRQCVRAGDTAARLGGDEFVLIFSDLIDETECERAVSRVLSALNTPFVMAARSIELSASVGVTLYPQDGSDADTLLRHADQAMYLAKQAGRNRFQLFDTETHLRARHRHGQIGQIHEALNNDEFVLFYQPKVNMREGRVLGAEALIRWQHPEHGLLLPGAFLPLIEGDELDIRLGEWVLKKAMEQLAEWYAQGLAYSVSVNISGPHLQHPEFVNFLRKLLAQHPLVPPSALELEILETAALEDIARVADVFEECRQLGVHFALDDFGTGYSSLTYFRRLPADLLKIDQSFVRDMLTNPDDLAIVEGVIGLTKAFERKVIAEGVETPEHGMVLLQLGCDLAQGYGIARPMPAGDFPAWTTDFKAHDLWNAVSSFSWSRDDLPLLLAELDHKQWMVDFRRYLDAAKVGQSIPVPELKPHRCRFGKWFHSKAKQRYQDLPAFQNLDHLHNQVHATGERLSALVNQGQLVEACRMWGELEKASESLVQSLEQLQAEALLVGVHRH